MKLMIASDIHGSLYYCDKLLDRYAKEQPDKLLLLGDLLYHGPRNDLPRDYNPKGVIARLNTLRQEILCVRGNCEAEVDQMVLEFPVLADYLLLWLEGRMVFATHGHHFHKDALPPLHEGDILLHGHTHLQAIEEVSGIIYLNPGSVSLPKGQDVNSCMVYEDGVFTIQDLDGRRIADYAIR